jgi:hypothetical protein
VDLTGWWIGYSLGAVVVGVVAALLVAIILIAKRIANVAEDATRSLALARARTEVLWELATTNRIGGEILAGAVKARSALGVGQEPSRDRDVETAQRAETHPLPTGPELDPELGT